MEKNKITWLIENFKECIYYGIFYKGCANLEWFKQAIKLYGENALKNAYKEAFKEMEDF